MNVNQTKTWSNFVERLNAFIHDKGGAGKVRIRVLTGTITSPTIAAQMKTLQSLFPHMVWHQHDSVGHENANAGVQRLFGRALTPVYDFTQARRILSLDAHFLADEPGSVRYAREFAQRRRLAFKGMGPVESLAAQQSGLGLTAETMARLYVAESTVTHTGARADHRLPIKAGDIAAVAALLADSSRATPLPQMVKAWIAAAMNDLRQASEGSLILAGEKHPAEVQADVHALNGTIGAIGSTVRYVERVDFRTEHGGDKSLAALTDALHEGDVDLLFILDCNPAFTVPSDLRFAETLRQFSMDAARLTVGVSSHMNETSELCQWNVPLSHALEAWGDCRGHDGTASIIQPLIEPLYASKSIVEMLGTLIGAGGQAKTVDGYEIVRATWFNTWGPVTLGEKEMRWRKSLHNGVIENTASEEVHVVPRQTVAAALAELDPLIRVQTGIEVNLRADPSVHAGEWANNPWLQELPKPLTRLTWDNAALMSPGTAARLNIGETADRDHESRVHQPVIRLTTTTGGCRITGMDSSRSTGGRHHRLSRRRQVSRGPCAYECRGGRQSLAHHKKSLVFFRCRDQKTPAHLSTRLHTKSSGDGWTGHCP